MQSVQGWMPYLIPEEHRTVRAPGMSDHPQESLPPQLREELQCCIDLLPNQTSIDIGNHLNPYLPVRVSSRKILLILSRLGSAFSFLWNISIYRSRMQSSSIL